MMVLYIKKHEHGKKGKRHIRKSFTFKYATIRLDNFNQTKCQMPNKIISRPYFQLPYGKY